MKKPRTEPALLRDLAGGLVPPMLDGARLRLVMRFQPCLQLANDTFAIPALVRGEIFAALESLKLSPQATLFSNAQ